MYHDTKESNQNTHVRQNKKTTTLSTERKDFIKTKCAVKKSRLSSPFDRAMDQENINFHL